MLVLSYLSSRYVEERSFRRFVEACLEETVVVYVDHLLTQVQLKHCLLNFPFNFYMDSVLVYQR